MFLRYETKDLYDIIIKRLKTKLLMLHKLRLLRNSNIFYLDPILGNLALDRLVHGVYQILMAGLFFRKQNNI